MVPYPDELTNLPTTGFGNDTLQKDFHPGLHDDVNAAVNAIEAVMGLNPQGGFTSIVERLDMGGAGPKGDKGDTGATGPKGAEGPQGQQGEPIVPVELGEVEGEITLDIALGNVFILKAKGPVTIKKPINWPAEEEILIVLTQDSTGHLITLGAGIDQVGGPTAFNIEPNQSTFLPIASYDGGATVFAINSLEGREGQRGPEGIQGIQGVKGDTGQQGPTGATGATKALGEVTGTVKLNLAEALGWTMTVKGNVTIEFENWPAGLSEPELFITEDATGGHTITIPSVTWQNETPEFSTSPNALNIVPLSSPNGGANVFGMRGQRGATGTTGAKGDTGATGPKGSAGGQAYSKLILPYHSGNPKVQSAAAIGTAFKADFILVLVEVTGTLKKLLVYNGTVVNGNTRVGVLDVGLKAAEKFSVLGQSASVEQLGTSQWQSINLETGVPVVAGELLVFAVMNSGATGTYGFGTAQTVAAAGKLPEGAINGYPSAMGQAIVTGVHTHVELKFVDLSKASIEAAITSPVILGVVE